MLDLQLPINKVGILLLSLSALAMYNEASLFLSIDRDMVVLNDLTLQNIQNLGCFTIMGVIFGDGQGVEQSAFSGRSLTQGK